MHDCEWMWDFKKLRRLTSICYYADHGGRDNKEKNPSSGILIFLSEELKEPFLKSLNTLISVYTSNNRPKVISVWYYRSKLHSGIFHAAMRFIYQKYLNHVSVMSLFASSSMMTFLKRKRLFWWAHAGIYAIRIPLTLLLQVGSLSCLLRVSSLFPTGMHTMNPRRPPTTLCEEPIDAIQRYQSLNQSPNGQQACISCLIFWRTQTCPDLASHLI